MWGKKIDPSLEGFESPKSLGFFKQSRLYRLLKKILVFVNFSF
ncbi:hypothetical protein A607_0056 [Helicobacter pylori UMB_G1]|nr:hypothetical protein OUG_0017 [Helicobacter pylori R32b]EMR56261.1 hypothetical protein A607_0056 [Helicobacter pylori UMB_G1]